MLTAAETLYAKRGRRYVPVAEYDPALTDAMPEGAHLVVVRPGRKTTLMRIEPADAAVLATLVAHEDAVVKAIHEASEYTPAKRLLTPREQRAWAAWKAVMGDGLLVVSKPAAREIVDALRRSIVAASKAG